MLLLYNNVVINHCFSLTYFIFFQEKRAAQLKSYDVEESDIDTTHLVKESGKKKNYNIANKKQPPIIPGVKVKAEEKGKQMIFVITFYKCFIKVMVSYQKYLSKNNVKYLQLFSSKSNQTQNFHLWLNVPILQL